MNIHANNAFQHRYLFDPPLNRAIEPAEECERWTALRDDLVLHHPHYRTQAEHIKHHRQSQPAEPYPDHVSGTSARLILNFSVHSASSMTVYPAAHDKRQGFATTGSPALEERHYSELQRANCMNSRCIDVSIQLAKLKLGLEC